MFAWSYTTISYNWMDGYMTTTLPKLILNQLSVAHAEQWLKNLRAINIPVHTDSGYRWLPTPSMNQLLPASAGANDTILRVRNMAWMALNHNGKNWEGTILMSNLISSRKVRNTIIWMWAQRSIIVLKYLKYVSHTIK